MWLRKIAGIAVALLSVSVLAAGGAGATESKPAIAVEVGNSVNAWECNAGDLCVWEDTNGEGRRCTWTNADSDWTLDPVVCSWAATTPVESYWNRGQSTSFTGVELYRQSGWYWQSKFHCAPQGTQWNVTNGGVLLRSHRWITGTCN